MFVDSICGLPEPLLYRLPLQQLLDNAGCELLSWTKLRHFDDVSNSMWRLSEGYEKQMISTSLDEVCSTGASSSKGPIKPYELVVRVVDNLYLRVEARIAFVYHKQQYCTTFSVVQNTKLFKDLF